MDWNVVIEFLNGLAPWVQWIFVGLGSLVVVGSGIDKIIPDEIDGGFMSKVLSIPVLGGFLSFLKKFSPFNVKE